MRAVVVMPVHRPAAAQLAAAGAHVVGQRAAHGGEVDDGGVGRVEGGDAGRVRLDLAQPVGVESADAGHPVGARAALELVEGGQLVGAQRDDELAHAPDVDAALLAVGDHPRGAVDAQARLQRAAARSRCPPWMTPLLCEL